jgi:hypothetical protein
VLVNENANKHWNRKVREEGCDYCIVCSKPWSEVACCRDDGCNDDGGPEFHIDGYCEECCPGNKH